MFLPPPMEGLISLGIYNGAGKLVRVLHREATAAEFVAALDGFITHWDGLDDAGKPEPPGHYSAHGYMVGDVTIQEAPQAETAKPSAASIATLKAALQNLILPNGKAFVPQSVIHATLVSNPLEQDRPGSADLMVGFDAKGSWLQLTDGLPLKRISTTPNLKWAVIGHAGPGQTLTVFQCNGAFVDEFTITKVSDMMAFDCGGFDFPEPAK